MGKRLNEIAYNLVRRGNRKHLRRLLAKHPRLRMSNQAMLVFAAVWHNRGMLHWLLERGVSPDCGVGEENGNTPLMHAAANGDISSMQVLLKFGANPNALNAESENPLGFAVACEQLEATRLLLASGAEVNNTEDSGPERTQLDWAELSNWTEGASLLREFGGKRYSELLNDENHTPASAIPRFT